MNRRRLTAIALAAAALLAAAPAAQAAQHLPMPFTEPHSAVVASVGTMTAV